MAENGPRGQQTGMPQTKMSCSRMRRSLEKAPETSPSLRAPSTKTTLFGITSGTHVRKVTKRLPN